MTHSEAMQRLDVLVGRWQVAMHGAWFLPNPDIEDAGMAVVERWSDAFVTFRWRPDDGPDSCLPPRDVSQEDLARRLRVALEGISERRRLARPASPFLLDDRRAAPTPKTLVCMAVSAILPPLLPRPSVSPLRCVKGRCARLRKAAACP